MARRRANTDWLESLEYLIATETSKLLSEIGDDQKVAKAVEGGIQEVLATAPAEYAHAMKKRARSMLRERRRLTRGFEKRTFRRWRPAFDRLELVWRAAEETTSAFNERYRPDAAENNDYVFEALTRLNGRGLQVAAEVIQLLKGGYPEGALSRWRTLHEILVTALFIKNAEPVVAERYLASVDFTRLKAAKQLNRYADRANLQCFSDEELSKFKRRCEGWEQRFGVALDDYNWARPGIAGATENFRITFFHLEEETGLDHWRPRYKWASQHTHAGHRDPGSGLGLVEAEVDVILVGASNSGFVDPMQIGLPPV